MVDGVLGPRRSILKISGSCGRIKELGLPASCTLRPIRFQPHCMAAALMWAAALVMTRSNSPAANREVKSGDTLNTDLQGVPSMSAILVHFTAMPHFKHAM